MNIKLTGLRPRQVQMIWNATRTDSNQSSVEVKDTMVDACDAVGAKFNEAIDAAVTPPEEI